MKEGGGEEGERERERACGEGAATTLKPWILRLISDADVCVYYCRT